MAGCARGGEEAQIDDRKYNVIRIIDAKVLNPNGPNVFVQNGDAAHSSSKKQVIDYLYEAGPENKKATSHSSSTAQIDVPHTHGVACWCCWAAAFCRRALCVLAVLKAQGGAKTDRMLPLGLVHEHDVHRFFGFASEPSYAK